MKIEKYRDIFSKFSGKTLFCGFSGGADSTAALLLARRFQNEFRYSLTAVHVNHHLRGAESDAEAENARIFAEQRNIPFLRFDLSLPHTGNLEDEARQGRLNVWGNLTAGHPGCFIVTGHHADDREENLLLHLARGGNASSLVSMRSESVVGNVHFIRPLLDLTRAEILEFLQGNGIADYARDSSNADNSYQRNFLRNVLLPEWKNAFPPTASGLRRAVESLEDDADFLEKSADLAYVSLTGRNEIPALEFQSLHPAVGIRVLRKFLQEHSAFDAVPDRALFERFQQFLLYQGSEPKALKLRPDLTVFLAHNLLHLLPETPPPGVWNWRKDAQFRWGKFRFQAEISAVPREIKSTKEALFDADILPGTLCIRRLADGDKIVPFGGECGKPLKKFRVDRKHSSLECLPVLTDEAGTVLWAPSIRHSNHAAVTKQTKASVLLRFFEE